MREIPVAFLVFLHWACVWSHDIPVLNAADQTHPPPPDDHTDWTILGSCERPKSGMCFLAGTCCDLRHVGYNVGVISWERNHVHENVDCGGVYCPGHTRTTNCPLKCHLVDLNAFTDWKHTPCERPSTGKCSFNRQCCSMPKGLITSTRECRVPGTCHPSTLKKTTPCEIRCRYDKPDDHLYRTGFQQASTCMRPTRGNCKMEGTCCGHPRGTMLMTRECKMDQVCWPANLRKTIRCNIRCHTSGRRGVQQDSPRGQNSPGGSMRSGNFQQRKVRINEDDYTEWQSAGDCIRPTTGDCSFEGMCCGALVGTMNFIRECKSDKPLRCERSALKRTKRCNVRCNTDAELETYTEWRRISDCERPASGKCSLEGSCCKQKMGTLHFTRRCKDDSMNSKCHVGALKRTRECRLHCSSTQKIDPRPPVFADEENDKDTNDEGRHGEVVTDQGHDHHDHEDHDHDSLDSSNHHSHINGKTHYHSHR